jgi:DNA polymerase elongation subunit (family B)
VNSKNKVLLYDIETSLQTVTVFGLGNNDWIHPDSIVTERHLISISWKWLANPKVYSVSLLDDPKRFKRDHHDDRHVVTVFHRVLSEADVIVGHNSDRFDLPYLKTRMLYHGLAPLPPITALDTYKIAKSVFAFNSNKLDYIGKYLKVGKKISTTPGLWKKVCAAHAKPRQPGTVRGHGLPAMRQHQDPVPRRSPGDF